MSLTEDKIGLCCLCFAHCLAIEQTYVLIVLLNFSSLCVSRLLLMLDSLWKGAQLFFPFPLTYPYIMYFCLLLVTVFFCLQCVCVFFFSPKVMINRVALHMRLGYIKIEGM